MITIWLIGWAFTVGWDIASPTTNTVPQNWGGAILALVFWPMILGYEVRKRL